MAEQKLGEKPNAANTAAAAAMLIAALEVQSDPVNSDHKQTI